MTARELIQDDQGMCRDFGSIEESPGPQNPRVQKVMFQESTGFCTRYTRANALFPDDHTYDRLMIPRLTFHNPDDCLRIICIINA